MEGTPFGRYRLVDLLGRGGMGEVWRAFDTVTERVVALKVLPVELANDESFQQRFRREARSAAGLNEPHVVPIHDFGEIDGRLFVTMRLIEGEDLQKIIDRGPLPPNRAVAIIEQIASALHAAHRVGLVHRDVKPSNILIAENDFAYLIDYGIARAAGESGLTNTGATIGTWAYMSPERFEHGTADASVDVYALTCVLHQALTGEIPFPGTSLEQIAMAHMVKPPPQPSTLQSGIPTPMDIVIGTGMAKDVGDRYATTVELARAAHAALAPSTPRSPLAPTHDEPVTASVSTLAATRPISNDPPTRVIPTASAPPRPGTEVQPPELTSPVHSPRSRRLLWGALAAACVAVVAVVVVLVMPSADRDSGTASGTASPSSAALSPDSSSVQPISTTSSAVAVPDPPGTLRGNYRFQSANGKVAVWTITPCGTGCASVQSAAGDYEPYSGQAALTGNTWSMTAQRPDAAHCGQPGVYFAGTTTYSWDPSSLSGSYASVMTDGPCGHNRLFDPVNFTLTKVG